MSLVSLPGDILRHIARKYLNVRRVFPFCLLCRYTYQVIARDESFWRNLMRERLTSDPEISVKFNKHPKVILWQFFVGFKYHYDRLRYAAQHGFDSFIQNKIHYMDTSDMFSLAIISVQRGQVKIYAMLTSRISYYPYNDLMEAVKSKNLDMVKYVSERMDLFQHFHHLKTAFDKALEIDLHIAEYLLGKGLELSGPLDPIILPHSNDIISQLDYQIMKLNVMAMRFRLNECRAEKKP